MCGNQIEEQGRVCFAAINQNQAPPECNLHNIIIDLLEIEWPARRETAIRENRLQELQEQIERERNERERQAQIAAAQAAAEAQLEESRRQQAKLQVDQYIQNVDHGLIFMKDALLIVDAYAKTSL